MRVYKSGKFLLLEGRPGSGKTTLVRKVSKDWAEGKPFLKGAELVFLVSLRLLSKKADTKLEDILEVCNSEIKNREEVSKGIEKAEGKGVCFIFDGLDEYKEREFCFVSDH